MSAATLRVYAAIRGRVGFEPAANNFLNCWPGVPTIASDAGVKRDSVIRAVKWLAERDYIFVERGKGPKGCNRYSVIAQRASFRELMTREGRAAAFRAFETWRTEKAAESRRAQAKEAAERKAHQEPSPGRKSQPCYPPDGGVAAVQPGGSQGCDMGGSSGATRSVYQEIRVSKIRGAAPAAPVSDSENRQDSESNGNDPDRPEITAMVKALGRRKAMPATSTSEEQREAGLAKQRRATAGWRE